MKILGISAFYHDAAAALVDGGEIAAAAQEERFTRRKHDPRFPDLPANWKADSYYRLPLQGAESLLEAGERVSRHLQQRMSVLGQAGARGRLKIFVGHGAALRHAAYYLGVLDRAQIAKLSMYHGQPVVLEYLADGKWRHFEGDWKVRTPVAEELD